MPRISVIVAAYNAEPYIRRGVESVLAQTMQDLEVIVADDGSADGTCDVVEALEAQDSRVKLVRNEKNGGPGYARNAALRAASGEWVAVLDADDWFEPRRLEILLGKAAEAGMSLIADNQAFILEGTETPYRLLRQERPGATRLLSADDVLRGDQIGKTGNLGLLKPIVRKQILDEHNIWYDESNGLGEDFFWLLHCLRHTGSLLFVLDPLYNYNIRGNSWSNTLTRNNYIRMRNLLERYIDLFDPTTAPTTASLMARRGRDIDQHIRYQELAEPLKRGEVRLALDRALADPAALRFLIPGMARASFRRIVWKYVRLGAPKNAERFPT